MPVPRDMLQHALALMQARHYGQAHVVLKRCAAVAPADASVQLLLGTCCYYMGDVASAAAHARRATALDKSLGPAFNLAGQCDIALDKLDSAETSLRRATELSPTDATALNALGALCIMTQRLDEAFPWVERALALNPTGIEVLLNMAGLLQQFARSDDAAPLLRRSVELDPDSVIPAMNCAAGLAYTAHTTQEERLARARHAAGIIERAAAGGTDLWRAHERDDAWRTAAPLRVTIVSHDFREHSCAYFMRPILAHLPRERGQFHVDCVSLHRSPDATTNHLRMLCESRGGAWTHAPEAQWPDLARIVALHRPHILLDMGGYTASTGIGAAAFGPAPLCITAIAYPSTTGLSCVHHRVVDALTDVPGVSERWHSESLLRLDPCFLCYDPGPTLPAPRQRREGPSDPVFVSFNAPQKLCARTLDLWCRVLREVPASTLFLKGGTLGTPRTRDHLHAQCAARGVDPSRIRCMGRIDAPDHHLRAYDQGDIALDTTPYAGTTTTCEALLMGVPVVTLAGNDHVSRVGVSLLSAAGLGELIARDDDDYVRIALELARDRPRRDALHATLRDRLLASPLCDGPRYGHTLASALRSAWNQRAAALGLSSQPR